MTSRELAICMWLMFIGGAIFGVGVCVAVAGVRS